MSAETDPLIPSTDDAAECGDGDDSTWARPGASAQASGEGIPTTPLSGRRTSTSDTYRKKGGSSEIWLIDGLGGNFLRDSKIFLTNEQLEKMYPKYEEKKFLTLPDGSKPGRYHRCSRGAKAEKLLCLQKTEVSTRRLQRPPSERWSLHEKLCFKRTQGRSVPWKTKSRRTRESSGPKLRQAYAAA